MKKSVVLVSGLIAVTAWIAPAYADLTVVDGKVTATYVDPDDLVIELDVVGQCGSNFFHVQRARTNFKEMAAAALVAVAGGKQMILFVESCVSDRNILSHGAVLP